MPNAQKSLVSQSDKIRVLGETGKTVIYTFPDGRGVAERQIPDFDAVAKPQPPAISAEMQLLEELVAAGKMTLAQQAVVKHDQDSTGMTVADILIARGWL